LKKRLLSYRKEWTEYVDASFDENELDRMRTSVNRQTPLGDADMADESVQRIWLGVDN